MDLSPETEDYIRESIEYSLGLPVSTQTLQLKLKASEESLIRIRNQYLALHAKLKEKDETIERTRAESSMNASALKKFVEENQRLAVECSNLLAQCKRWEKECSLYDHDREALMDFGNEADERAKEAEIRVHDLEEEVRKLSEELHFYKCQYETQVELVSLTFSDEPYQSVDALNFAWKSSKVVEVLQWLAFIRQDDTATDDASVEQNLLANLLETVIDRDDAASTAYAFLEGYSGIEVCQRLLTKWKRLRPSTQQVISLVAEVNTLQKDKEHLRINLHKAEDEVNVLFEQNNVLEEANKRLIRLYQKEKHTPGSGGKPSSGKGNKRKSSPKISSPVEGKLDFSEAILAFEWVVTILGNQVLELNRRKDVKIEDFGYLCGCIPTLFKNRPYYSSSSLIGDSRHWIEMTLGFWLLSGACPDLIRFGFGFEALYGQMWTWIMPRRSRTQENSFVPFKENIDGVRPIFGVHLCSMGPIPDGSGVSLAIRVGQFIKMGPLIFTGVKVEEDPQAFLDEIEKIFQVIEEMAEYQSNRMIDVYNEIDGYNEDNDDVLVDDIDKSKLDQQHKTPVHIHEGVNDECKVDQDLTDSQLTIPDELLPCRNAYVNLGQRSENYGVWSRSMRIALLVKRKYGFVTGTYSKDTYREELHDQWKTCNAIVLSSIMSFVSTELLSGIVYATNASEMHAQDFTNNVTGDKVYGGAGQAASTSHEDNKEVHNAILPKGQTFTDGEYKQIMDVLNKDTPDTNYSNMAGKVVCSLFHQMSQEWIVDSGATHNP
ncbi:putative myosin heavy chain-like isoform X2 [Capsicum annuum]|nr:putative myosin heavy chain-like isoform X2 [Capsicum annuum]